MVKISTTTLERARQHLVKLHVCVPCDPVILLLDMKLRKPLSQVKQEICTKIFIAALNNSNINQNKVDKSIVVYLYIGILIAIQQ